jgi:hypothetical protein
MTSISNYFLIENTCCRTLYAAPEYSSINLSAREYWSDGHKEAALFVEDGGLSKCSCGAFYLLREALRLEEKPEPDTQVVQPIEDSDLPLAVKSCSKPIELQARRLYWRYLNHEYRLVYKAHMVASAQGKIRSSAAARLVSLCLELAVKGLLPDRDKAKASIATPDNHPPFEPSADQKLNMERLIELIQERGHDDQPSDMAEVAELYRELGLFDQAKEAINRSSPDRTRLPIKLIARMIDSKQRAPFSFT